MIRLLVLSLTLLLAGCSSAPQGTRTLAVNVHGTVSVQPTSFSGYYEYEDQAGVTVRQPLSGNGSVNQVFPGRRILRVSLRRTSAGGLIGLVVTSDGRVVYDSGMLRTDELIVYEADT